jgi:hypothetical protein
MPREIPGFANLNDMASDPHLVEYFGEKVSRTWANLAFDYNMPDIFLKGSMSVKESKKEVENIKLIHQIKMQPELLLVPKEDTLKTHAVLASEVIETLTGVTICLRDNNFGYRENKACVSKVEIGHDGKIFHHAGELVKELKIMRVTHNTTEDLIQQLYNLRHACAKKYDGCMYEIFYDEIREELEGI